MRLLAALTDVTRRPARPRQVIPDELLQFRPPAQVHICAAAELYKVLLDQADALELLAEAATLLACADVPREVAAGVVLARMTAIQKPGRGP